MSIKLRDKEFRTPKVSYLEFKHTDMDRVLTLLFPRLKYDGYGSRKPPRANNLQPEAFVEEILSGDKMKDYFQGFEKYPDILKKWVETDLMDIVNRGKSNQAIAAPRPLHGETYKFRNAKHCRDYGAAEQIYWMLYYARGGKGQAARDLLKKFFFPGVDLLTDKYDSSVTVDVETQALLRFNEQVESDMKDKREPERFPPLCIEHADLLAEDIIKILAYEPYIPRSVLVEYLKTLMAFHLGIYHLKLLHLLPEIVQTKNLGSICTEKDCPLNSEEIKTNCSCTYKINIIVDIGSNNNHHMTGLAERSSESFYQKIPAFVQANYIIKKLDEMAEYLIHKS